MCLTDILYFMILVFVKVCKWIELLFLKLFSPLLIPLAIRHCAKIGIIFHFPSDPQWTMDDEEKALAKMAKSGHKFGSLVHVQSKKSRSCLMNCMNRGVVVVAEYYIDNSWEFSSLEQVTEFMSRVTLTMAHLYLHPWNRFLQYLEFHLFNLQTLNKAKEVVKKHYDLGNDLFQSFLDPWMQYTCGYWDKADNLDSAQIDKMELIAKKLDLKPGMRVLDIGCGWGTLCKYLAENYGVSCVGINISEEGVNHGKKICNGLQVDIRLQDYRDLNEKFDRIVSVGMFEHVGKSNYKKFFEVAHRCLTDDGIFLLHTIGVNHPPHIMVRLEAFTHTYVFPNGCLPLLKHIADSTFGLFIVEDWHNFGPDYVKTLTAWRDNFCKNWPSISGNYDEKFYRLWTFYLSAAAALFQTRRTQLWQIVLTKDGLKREYRAAR